MEKQPRGRRGLWIGLIAVGVIIAAVAALIVLALPSRAHLDRLARAPAAAASPSGVTGVVVIPSEHAEALVERELAGAFAQTGAPEYLGVAVDTERGAVTIMSGARARVLGTRRVPIVVRARASVSTLAGGDAVVRLDRVWLGRLPVPRALVVRAAREAVDPAELARSLDPLAMTYDPDTLELRWALPFAAGTGGAASAFPLPGGVEITSVDVSSSGVRLGISLPTGLDDELRATAIALLDDREEIVRRVRGALGDDYDAELASFDRALEEPAIAIAEPRVQSGAVVSYTEGTAVARPPGEPERALWLGDRLPVGTTIETGRNGSAELALPGEHRLIVRSATTVTLDDATLTGAAGTTRAHISATAGKLRAVVAELTQDGELAVDTPNGTLGVRGTDFVVDVDRSSTELSVLDGAVAVAGDVAALAAATVYSAGRAVAVEGGSVESVSEIAPDEIDRLRDEHPIRTSDELMDALLRPNALSIVMPLITRYGDVWLRLSRDEQDRLRSEFGRYLEANPRVAARIDRLAARLDPGRAE